MYCVSQVSEASWLSFLNIQPTLETSSKPLVLVSPHPDDETLGAGGLVRAHRNAGLHVTVIAVTDGECAYGYDPALATVRQAEQAAALAVLGVPPENLIRLSLPDSNVTAHEDELVQRLRALVSDEMHLLAPWTGDFHPDHEACGRAALAVAQQTGAELSFYFFWTWHNADPSLLQPLSLRRFPLSPSLLASKSKALQCHRSQLQRSSGDPVLPEALLAPAHRAFEIFSVAA